MYLGIGRWMRQFSSNNTSKIYTLLYSAKTMSLTLMWFNAAFNVILIHAHTFTNTVQLYKVKQKTYGYKICVWNQILLWQLTSADTLEPTALHFAGICDKVSLRRDILPLSLEYIVLSPFTGRTATTTTNKKKEILLTGYNVMWDEASVLLGYDTTLYPRRTLDMLDHVFFFWARQPQVGQGLLIHEVSR